MTFDATTVTAILGSITALVIAMSGLLVAVAKLKGRDDYTDRRVDMLWQAHMRMGKREAEEKSFIVMGRSKEEDAVPLYLRPDVRAAYEPIVPALKALYKQCKTKNLTEVQFTEAIEQKFGHWLSSFICKALDLKEYACLEMAKIVAMEDDSVLEQKTADLRDH